jgi:hypothetical protein
MTSTKPRISFEPLPTRSRALSVEEMDAVSGGCQGKGSSCGGCDCCFGLYCTYYSKICMDLGDNDGSV